MHVIAFAGPSRPAAPDPAIDWRPPAAAGDMLAVIAERPARVVLIDGYFDCRPAPWHKEILLLMEHGVPVIGAASMGALRAAELARYGMIGIGAIFEAYRSGRIVADDEVAVLHAPEALGWRALTEPMVNVRATLVAAVRAGAIDGTAARAIRAVAAGLNFRDREWSRILAEAEGRVAPEPRARLAAWLPANRVDLKGEDAARAIAVARSGAIAAPASYPTPRTFFLRRLAARGGVALDEAALPEPNAA